MALRMITNLTQRPIHPQFLGHSIRKMEKLTAITSLAKVPWWQEVRTPKVLQAAAYSHIYYRI